MGPVIFLIFLFTAKVSLKTCGLTVFEVPALSAIFFTILSIVLLVIRFCGVLYEIAPLITRHCNFVLEFHPKKTTKPHCNYVKSSHLCLRFPLIKWS